MAEKVTIGNCELWHGDCRDILPTLPKVDAVITDPPYSERTHAGHDANTKDRRDGANARELGYAALTKPQAVELARLFHAVTTGWVVWFTDSELATFVRHEFDSIGRTTFAPLPYHHPGRSVRLSGDGPSSWTDWIVVARTKAQAKWGTLRGGYVAGPGWADKERMGGKPLTLMQYVVSDYSKRGDTVLDPFMGSGTTGVACARAGRKFIGCEVDRAAFDLACERIAAAYAQGSLLDLAQPVPEQQGMGF